MLSANPNRRQTSARLPQLSWQECSSSKNLVSYGRYHQHNMSTFSCSSLVEILLQVQPAQAQELREQCREDFLITTGSWSIIPKQQIWTCDLNVRCQCLWHLLQDWMSMSSMRCSALVLVLGVYEAAQTQNGHNGLLPLGY